MRLTFGIMLMVASLPFSAFAAWECTAYCSYQFGTSLYMVKTEQGSSMWSAKSTSPTDALRLMESKCKAAAEEENVVLVTEGGVSSGGASFALATVQNACVNTQ